MTAKYILQRVGRIATIRGPALHGREISFDIERIVKMTLFDGEYRDAQLRIELDVCEGAEQDIRLYHTKGAELRKLRHDIAEMTKEEKLE